MAKDSDMICINFFIFNELYLLSHGGLKPTAFAKLTYGITKAQGFNPAGVN